VSELILVRRDPRAKLDLHKAIEAGGEALRVKKSTHRCSPTCARLWKTRVARLPPEDTAVASGEAGLWGDVDPDVCLRLRTGDVDRDPDVCLCVRFSGDEARDGERAGDCALALVGERDGGRAHSPATSMVLICSAQQRAGKRTGGPRLRGMITVRSRGSHSARGGQRACGPAHSRGAAADGRTVSILPFPLPILRAAGRAGGGGLVG